MFSDELSAVVEARLCGEAKAAEEARMDDGARNSSREATAKALWEVCRRCEDKLNADMKAQIAARAFVLRQSSFAEVRQQWDAIWGEVCPSSSSGAERHHPEICKALIAVLNDSTSRIEKKDAANAVTELCSLLERQDRPGKWTEDQDIAQLRETLGATVESLPAFEGSALLVKALSDITALIFLLKAPNDGDGSATAEARVRPARAPAAEAAVMADLSRIRTFLRKPIQGARSAALADRTTFVQAITALLSKTLHWASLGYEEMASIAEEVLSLVDKLEEESRKEAEEEREEGTGEDSYVAARKKHRGKPGSNAEELIQALLELWTTMLEASHKVVEDEDELEAPDSEQFELFVRRSLAEFETGSPNLQLFIVRCWKRSLVHLKSIRVKCAPLLNSRSWVQMVSALQDASLDKRMGRLRKTALDLLGGSELAGDTSAQGGGEALKTGLGDGDGTKAKSQLKDLIENLDAQTRTECAEAVESLEKLQYTLDA